MEIKWPVSFGWPWQEIIRWFFCVSVCWNTAPEMAWRQCDNLRYRKMLRTRDEFIRLLFFVYLLFLLFFFLLFKNAISLFYNFSRKRKVFPVIKYFLFKEWRRTKPLACRYYHSWLISDFLSSSPQCCWFSFYQIAKMTKVLLNVKRMGKKNRQGKTTADSSSRTTTLCCLLGVFIK